METLPVHSMEIAMADVSPEIVVKCPPGQHKSQQEAVSEMGLMTTETKAEDFVTIDMPPVVSPTPENVSILGSSSVVYEVGASSGSKQNSEHQTGTLSMDEVSILALGDPRLSPYEKSPFTKPALTLNRATSLPAIPFQSLIPYGIEEYQPIYRSHSVPVSYFDVIMTEDHARVLRVIPNRRSTERNTGLLSPAVILNGREDQDQDTITEEEAVCRICFEELGEDLTTFRLECDCRGDLALVHRHCSQKWFNIRGSRTCEICGKRVRNLTVRITRRINTSFWNQFQPPPMTYTDVIWNGLLVLFMASMMAYTLAIELITLRRHGENTNELYGALSASLLSALFTSTAASLYGEWKYVWIYALVQFVVFTVFAEFFYDLCRLGLIPTIILATFFAIGIGRGAEPAYHAIKKWRESCLNQVNNNPRDAALQIEPEPTEETNESIQSNDNHDEPNNEAQESHQLNAIHHDSNEEVMKSHQLGANHHESNEVTA